jgi:putative methionine-R-sulfoxide reductase with GAF domain
MNGCVYIVVKSILRTKDRNVKVVQQHMAQIWQVHTELVGADRSLDETLTQLAAGACGIAQVPLHRGHIRVIDPATGAIQQEVQADGAHSRMRDVFEVSLGITGRAMRERKPQLVADVRKDPDYVAASEDVRSELAIPLLQENTCWGVLNLESPRKGHFASWLIPLLDTLAQQAVLTIQYDNLRRQRRLAQVISSAEVRERYARLARATLHALPSASATIEVQLLSDNGDELATVASATDSTMSVIPGSFAKGSTLAWQAVFENMVIRKSHLHLEDPRTSLQTTLAAIVLPLHGRDGKARGVLNVEVPETSRLNDDQALRESEAILERFREQGELILREAARSELGQVTKFETVVDEIEDAIERVAVTANLDEFYGQIARSAAQMIGANVQASIFLVERNQYTGMDWLVFSRERAFQYEGALTRDESWAVTQGLSGLAARTGKIVCIQNVLDHDEAPEYKEIDASTRSELDVPIMHNQKALGVINLTSPVVGTFDEEEHGSKIKYLAQRVAGALDRLEQLRQWRTAQQHLQLIRRTNDGIEHMFDGQSQSALTEIRKRRTGLLEELLVEAQRESGFGFAAVLLAIEVPSGPSRRQDSAGLEVEREFISVASVPTKEFAIPLEHGMAQALFADPEAKLHNLEDISRLESSARPNTLLPDTRSVIGLPLNIGTGIIGALCLESSVPISSAPQKLEVLQLLASQMANIISAANLYLYRLQQQALIKLEREMVQASAGLSNEPVDAAMQRLLLTTALELTEQQDGYAELWFVHGKGVLLHSSLQNGKFQYGEEYTRPLSHAGIVALARDAKRPVLVLDVTWKRWAGIFKANWDQTRSELAVPLLDSSVRSPETDRGRVIGVLNIESPMPLAFGTRDIDILELLAQNTVTAIKNRELYRAKMDLLRDVTHAMQKALFPFRDLVFDLRQAAEGEQYFYEPGTKTDSLSAYRSEIEQIAEYSDMASNLLAWFQSLIMSEQLPESISKTPTDVSTLVQTLARRMRPWADGQEKTITAEIPSGQVPVNCDSGLIQGALFLLIDNALRYSPPRDAVVVRLLVTSAGAARVEVSDHGAQIPEDERDEIFGREVRGYAGRAQGTGETSGGLGLDHVRRIVEDIHQGHVDYARRDGENVFYIELPLLAVADPDAKGI